MDNKFIVRQVFYLLTLIVLFFGQKEVTGENSLLRTYVIRTITGVMVLPDTSKDSLPGSQSDVISVIATPGEYEPASFVLCPTVGIKSLKVEVTNLKNNSNLIPVSNIDIKIVKCWYQSKGAWKTENRLSYKKVLVPELLLNDDTLIKVDYKEEENYLRLIHPDGTSKYICISKKPETNSLDPHNPEIYFTAPGIGPETGQEFSVKDSPILLPVDISAGTNKQFWLTIKVPDEAKPGIYTGKINLSSSEGLLGSLTLNLNVLPFKLSEPRTYYDTNIEFTSSIYYRGVLDPTGKGAIFGGMLNGKMYDLKNEEQLRAEFKNMFIHGVTQPTICLPYSMIADNEKLFREILKIRKESGIVGPYYMVFDLMVNQQDETSLAELKVKAERLIKIAEEYSISEFYFYGIDEATGELLRSQRPAWKAIHEIGGKTTVAGYEDAFRAVGELLDLLVWNGAPSRDEAKKWHSIGHKIWCYSNPQAGIENPEIYRRNYGILLWKAEYDGASTYTYQTENGGWNDFNDIMRDLTFAYPTSNGVIDTIAWEGYREGIDDIKYATTLKLEIEKDKRGNDKNKKKIAEEAEQWIENLDVTGNLDAIRHKIIDYILKISEVSSEGLTGEWKNFDEKTGIANEISIEVKDGEKISSASNPEGLVGYWSFDENTGNVARDSSGNNNNGTISGAEWTKGKIGSGLRFDGIDDYVDCGNAQTLNMTDALTIEMWIKWTGDYTGPETEWGGIEKGHQYLLYGTIRGLSPKLQFYIKVWDDDRKRFEPGAGTGYLYDINTWYHVVGTYRNGNLKIYVNGELKASADKISAPSGAESVFIGKKWGIPFSGIVDEVRIYNRALSTDEVAKHYEYVRK